MTPWTLVSYGSSVHGILQAILLETVAIRFSRGSFWPRDKTPVSCIAGRFFTVCATREAPCICMCECERECVCIFKIASSLSIHLSVDICAAMNTGMHVSLWIINSPRSRIAVTSLSLFTFMHWRRQWQPSPVFLLGESQGWRSLVGCHLWGHTESDTTEAT